MFGACLGALFMTSLDKRNVTKEHTRLHTGHRERRSFVTAVSLDVLGRHTRAMYKTQR